MSTTLGYAMPLFCRATSHLTVAWMMSFCLNKKQKSASRIKTSPAAIFLFFFYLFFPFFFSTNIIWQRIPDVTLHQVRCRTWHLSLAISSWILQQKQFSLARRSCDNQCDLDTSDLKLVNSSINLYHPSKSWLRVEEIGGFPVLLYHWYFRQGHLGLVHVRLHSSTDPSLKGPKLIIGRWNIKKHWNGRDGYC